MKLIMENWKRFLNLNERYKGDRDVDSGKKPMKLVITNYMPNGFNLTAEVDFRKNRPKQNRVEILKAIKVLKVPQGQPVVVASMKMPWQLRCLRSDVRSPKPLTAWQKS